MPARAETGLALEVSIPAGSARLVGDLELPERAAGLVVFAHGSGSSRRSPRNRLVAERLRAAGFGTLLLDLLTASEEADDEAGIRSLRFDIPFLAGRLESATDWIGGAPVTAGLEIGYFGASTGAAAALVAAARQPGVRAVVSRGGRPDLAGDALEVVAAPTLLIVGGLDDTVLDLNRAAMRRLHCQKELVIVPGATHLFEEPGTLGEVARLAGGWFAAHLR